MPVQQCRKIAGSVHVCLLAHSQRRGTRPVLHQPVHLRQWHAGLLYECCQALLHFPCELTCPASTLTHGMELQVTVTYSGSSTTIYCPDCILQAVQPAAALDFSRLGPAVTAALAQVSEQVHPVCFQLSQQSPVKLFACGAQAQRQCPIVCHLSSTGYACWGTKHASHLTCCMHLLKSGAVQAATVPKCSLPVPRHGRLMLAVLSGGLQHLPHGPAPAEGHSQHHRLHAHTLSGHCQAAGHHHCLLPIGGPAAAP